MKMYNGVAGFSIDLVTNEIRPLLVILDSFLCQSIIRDVIHVKIITIAITTAYVNMMAYS